MLHQLTSIEDLEFAKRWVDHSLPRSIILSQWLKVNLDRPGGYGTTKGASTYVDCWRPSASPNIIVGVDYKNIHGVRDYPLGTFFTTFSPNDADHVQIVRSFLNRLCAEIGVGDRIGGVEVKAVEAQWRSTMDEIFADGFRLNSAIEYWPCRAYWIPKRERNRLRDRSIQPPAGFEFQPLRVDQAEFVDSTWSHQVVGTTLEWMKRQILHFPNISLKEIGGGGQLASFVMIEEHLGVLSHLYTVPEFRRRGLANLVEQKVAQMLVLAGHIPVKAVMLDNRAGMGITDANPMWEYCGDIVWARYGDAEMADRYE